MKPADVLVLTREKETASAVVAAIESGSVAAAPNLCATMLELRTQLSKKGTGGGNRVALVDIDEAPEYILYELSKVIATYPQTRFVVLSREFDEKLILHAMQVGARHFLRKNTLDAELNSVLERLVQQGKNGSERLGNVVSVFSCSGGCGATTVAVNIANELKLWLAKRVLIVDLDAHYGSVANYLGVKGRYSVGHVLNRHSRIDGHLIESTAVNYMDGFDVLLSPASAEFPIGAPLNYENLPAMVEACRESYDYVVIDAPRISRETALSLASTSRVSLVVFQLTVRDVTFAKSLLAYLADQGVSRDRLLPLANRVCRRGPTLKLADTRRAIGLDVLCPIRSDWGKVIKSLNRGQPLSVVARHSGLRRDYRRLAQQVHKYLSGGTH